MTSQTYPLPSRDALTKLYVGQSLSDVGIPAAILDVAKIKKNCTLMLNAVKDLEVSFRAHVKTHKTTEVTRLQVGEDSKDVRLIVSTLSELDHLLPLLQEYQQKQSKINVLFSLPIGLAHVDRLVEVAKQLGAGTITMMVDNPEQLASLQKFKKATGFPASVFIKTDVGYHRAGLLPESSKMIELVKVMSAAEENGDIEITGFYSHNSGSYGGNSPDDAMNNLKHEIEVCSKASQHMKATRSSRLVVSVGASPTALAIQNILPSGPSSTSSAKALQDILQLAQSNFELEIHAGVYPIFDLQQVAAQSRDFKDDDPHNAIAASVLTEVCSLYPDRTENPEALISAGCLALAREPCKDYRGWGVVSPWGMPASYNVSKKDRVIVGRASQEHGILVYETQEGNTNALPVKYGQKLRIWPNHACITLAMFDYYLVVDSSTSDPDKIVDVWVSCRGW